MRAEFTSTMVAPVYLEAGTVVEMANRERFIVARVQGSTVYWRTTPWMRLRNRFMRWLYGF